MSLILIFLVCITVYWLPYIISNMISIPFLFISEKSAEVAMGIALCLITIALMLFLRQYLDNPTMKDYGFSSKNLGGNLVLTTKLIFIIFAVDFLVLEFFSALGVSFESEPIDIDIFFILSAVIIAPIFEETVYRINASTLLARRLPIIWVAGITSVWFITKHIPMWHLDTKFGLAALSVIVPLEIIIWTVITYYFLKRKCIWIPFLLHVFNNGSIALFNILPETIADYLGLLFLGIGVVFIVVFAIPKFHHVVIQNIKQKKFKIASKTYYYLLIAAGLSLLFVITSEGLVGLQYINTILCLPIGGVLILISIITVVYIFLNKNTFYVKE